MNKPITIKNKVLSVTSSDGTWVKVGEPSSLPFPDKGEFTFDCKVEVEPRFLEEIVSLSRKDFSREVVYTEVIDGEELKLDGVINLYTMEVTFPSYTIRYLEGEVFTIKDDRTNKYVYTLAHGVLDD